MKFFILSLIVFLNICLQANAEQSFLESASGVVLISVEEPEVEKSEAEKPQAKEIDSWQTHAQEVLVNALSLTGIKYKYGGKTPETVIGNSLQQS